VFAIWSGYEMRTVLKWIVTGAVLAAALSATARAAETPASTKSSPNMLDEAAPHTAATTRVQFSAAYERLSNQFEPWRSAVMSVQTGGPNTVFHGELREQVRFSRFDHEVAVGVERRLGRRFNASGELAVSPSHEVSPMWAALGGLAVRAPAGWGARTSLQHRQYVTTGVDIGSVGVERYVGAYRVAYAVFLAHLQSGPLAVSQRVDGSVYYGSQNSSVGAILSAGEEIEPLPPFGVLTTPVRAIGVVGRQSLGRSWFLSYDVLAQRQGTLYTRQRLSVGLGRWF